MSRKAARRAAGSVFALAMATLAGVYAGHIAILLWASLALSAVTFAWAWGTGPRLGAAWRAFCHPREDVTALPRRTVLRLQFGGGIVREVHQENIFGWRAVAGFGPATLTGVDLHKDQPSVELSNPRHWYVFIIFDHPVQFRQLLVNFSAPGFPSWNEEWRSTRGVLLTVAGEIPVGALEVYTHA